MNQKPRTRTSRSLTICAWLLMIVLGVCEIKFKDHGVPEFLPLLQIAVSLLAVGNELTSLIQEPQ